MTSLLPRQYVALIVLYIDQLLVHTFRKFSQLVIVIPEWSKGSRSIIQQNIGQQVTIYMAP